MTQYPTRELFVALSFRVNCNEGISNSSSRGVVYPYGKRIGRWTRKNRLVPQTVFFPFLMKQPPIVKPANYRKNYLLRILYALRFDWKIINYKTTLIINLINKWERINSSIHSLFNIVDIIYIIGVYLINKGKEIVIKLQSEYNFIIIRKIWEMIFRSNLKSYTFQLVLYFVHLVQSTRLLLDNW